jgi:uncharacterized protein (TIGR02145 family)
MKSILICISLSLSVALFSQERRLALVIGNSAYEHGSVLKNPVSDAYLMAFTLEDLGFDVISVTNASHGEMEDAILNFWKQLEGFDVALFYYSGQAVQDQGVNYLVPVDAKLNDARGLKKEAVDLHRVVNQFEQLSSKINIVILDACGNDPVQSWVKEGSGGFAEMPVPGGSIIAFSASPGKSAPETDGTNGLYAQNLTQQMMVPQPIENVFSNTRLLVNHSSSGQQHPREWSQFTGSFGLIEGYPPSMQGNGSIVLSSQIAGNLYLDGLEIASVEPNTVIPLDNIEPGSYGLKIIGETTWEESVLVLGSQITNVAASAAGKREIYVDNEADQTVNKDSDEYPWMEFGSQIWMTRNLSFDISDGSFCYDDNSTNCDIYGRLYTWEAAQHVCPEGWHLPSDEEWMVLEQSIGLKEKAAKKTGLRGKVEGNVLKDTIQGLWSSQEKIHYNANGFNALPGGYSLNEKKSVEKEESAIFWTSTEYYIESAYYRKLEASKGGIHRYYSNKSRGCSVRCVKD